MHSLLGYRLAQHEAAWENQLDTHAQPALADHLVGDAVVFPGAGFAEVALAAALQRHPAEYAELENLEIHAPLLLAASPSKLVRTAIEADDGRIRVQARELGGEDGWTLHASARLLSEPGGSRLRAALLAPPDRQPDFLAADHETLTRAVGLNYGPAYQLIERGWRIDADTVLAALRPDDGTDGAHLAPARLDSAFQLAAHLLKDEALAGLGLAFVPVRIGRLSLHAHAAAPRYAQLRLRRRSAHALTVDIALYAEDGEPVAALAEVSLRSVRLLKAAGDRLGFVEEALTPRPRAGAASGVALRGWDRPCPMRCNAPPRMTATRATPKKPNPYWTRCASATASRRCAPWRTGKTGWTTTRWRGTAPARPGWPLSWTCCFTAPRPPATRPAPKPAGRSCPKKPANLPPPTSGTPWPASIRNISARRWPPAASACTCPKCCAASIRRRRSRPRNSPTATWPAICSPRRPASSWRRPWPARSRPPRTPCRQDAACGSWKSARTRPGSGPTAAPRWTSGAPTTAMRPRTKTAAKPPSPGWPSIPTPRCA
ncbi:polyketide synthase dehydratase domain-containing protein [Achromobacter denitrificans]